MIKFIKDFLIDLAIALPILLATVILMRVPVGPNFFGYFVLAATQIPLVITIRKALNV